MKTEKLSLFLNLLWAELEYSGMFAPGPNWQEPNWQEQ